MKPSRGNLATAAGMSRRSALIIGVGLLILYGIPLLWVVLTSLKTNEDIYAPGIGIFFHPTLDAYRGLLSQGLEKGLGNSLIVAVGTVVVTLAFGVPCAHGLARISGRWVAIVLSALTILQMVPQPATLIPLYKVYTDWSLLGTRTGLVLADAALLMPFTIIIMRPFFRAVPSETEEAALVDGAGYWGVFRFVSLPLARNGITTAAILVFFIAWGEFIYAVEFLSSPSRYPLSVLIANQVTQYGVNWPGLMAIATTTAVPLLVIFVFGYRFLREGLRVGAVR